MSTDLPEHVAKRVEYVSKYILNSTDDWLRVKREILTVLAPRHRSLFSRRHKTSKKHFLNDLEHEVMDFWETLTGVRLKMDPQNLHTSQDERPPRYWGLMELNKQRQMAARSKHEKD